MSDVEKKAEIDLKQQEVASVERAGVSASEEQLWVNAAKQGDEEAFRKLFERYFPKLYGALFHMVQDAGVAEDLAQTAMVQAWRRLDQFDGRSSFGTWLYRIGVNQALDWLRRRKNRRAESLEAMMEESGVEPEGPEQHPVNTLDNAELATALQDAMSKLSESHRQVFVLGEVQGLPYEEIGKILRCKRGTVMSRMHYARIHLQKLLKGYYDTRT